MRTRKNKNREIIKFVNYKQLPNLYINYFPQKNYI